MARRISITVDIDLARGSKEAHAVTIEKIANQIGRTATSLIENKGYTIEKAEVRTVLHYVRHELKTVLMNRNVRRILRKVAS